MTRKRTRPASHRRRTVLEGIARKRSCALARGDPPPDLKSWERKNLKGLTKRQQRKWQDLEDAAEQLRQSPAGEEFSDARLEDYKSYCKALRRPINDPVLRNHPYVREWLAACRSFGEWDELRTFKRHRLERGVPRRPSPAAFWMWWRTRELAAEGKKPATIQRTMLRDLGFASIPDRFGLTPADRDQLHARLKKMSRQRFDRLLRDLKIAGSAAYPPPSPDENE